jgi:hypothetical protein
VFAQSDLSLRTDACGEIDRKLAAFFRSSYGASLPPLRHIAFELLRAIVIKSLFHVEHAQGRCKMIKMLLLLTTFVLLFAISAAAQVNKPFPRTNDPRARPKDGPLKNHELEQDMNLPEEMRIRLAIERADSEYRKALEDAEKLNDLSVEVAKTYRERGQLSADEIKKLGTIEKLAKRILSQAGGDEVDDKAEKTAQKSVADAVDQLSNTAAKIKDSMKTQTRFVVSAAVIASSNEVINLAQYIRHSQK